MEAQGESMMGDVAASVSPGGTAVRVERFDTKSALKCEVRSASGSLRVSQGETLKCQIRMSTNDPDSQRRLAQVECVYDASTNQLLIDTKASQLTNGSGIGIKKLWNRWVESVRHDVDVELLVPTDASIKYLTASGDLSAANAIHDVEIASASGDVRLARVNGSLRFRCASGNLAVSDVIGAVETKTVSGDVSLECVSGEVNIQTVSGDVSLCIDKPVKAHINTVSGDVRTGVAAGLLIDVDANTVSGELISEIALGEKHGDSKEAALQLKVRTVSGDVRVHHVPA
jgi:hypothetical protein